MTTINTVEDFIRVMRENEDLRSAVRRELLTEELLTLPQRFAEYTVVTEKRFDRLETKVDNLEGKFDNLEGRFDRFETKFDQMTYTVGELKGLFMERVGRDDAPIIASEMELQWNRTLNRAELNAIADEAQRNGLTTGISRDSMRAFRRADLVIEATDNDGQTYFVAVEISYTADSRDTDRAVRHAGYLTRFTGAPAYAAISSVHADNRIENILTEETPKPGDMDQETRIFWSRLPEPSSPN